MNKSTIAFVAILLINLSSASVTETSQGRSMTPQKKFYLAIGATERQAFLMQSKLYSTRNALQSYVAGRLTPTQLQARVVSLVNMLRDMEKKYLSDVNNAIYGNDNTVAGTANRLIGNGQTIIGRENYSAIQAKVGYGITGSRWLRLGEYDIELDRIHMIHINPFNAIILNMFH